MFSGSAISQLWQAAFARGHGPEDHTSIYAFLENLSGEEEGDGRARI